MFAISIIRILISTVLNLLLSSKVKLLKNCQLHRKYCFHSLRYFAQTAKISVYQVQFKFNAKKNRKKKGKKSEIALDLPL